MDPFTSDLGLSLQPRVTHPAVELLVRMGMSAEAPQCEGYATFYALPPMGLKLSRLSRAGARVAVAST
jgi:hypothetical protein